MGTSTIRVSYEVSIFKELYPNHYSIFCDFDGFRPLSIYFRDYTKSSRIMKCRISTVHTPLRTEIGAVPDSEGLSLYMGRGRCLRSEGTAF